MAHLLATLKNIPLCRDYPTIKCRDNCACEIINEAIRALDGQPLVLPLAHREVEVVSIGGLGYVGWLVAAVLAIALALTPALPTPTPVTSLELPYATLATLSPAEALVATEPAPVPAKARRPRPTQHYDQNRDNLPCRNYRASYSYCSIIR
jgi:hypothetical protein